MASNADDWEDVDDWQDAPAAGGAPVHLEASPSRAPGSTPEPSVGDAILAGVTHLGGARNALAGLFTASAQAGDKLVNAAGGHRRGLTDQDGKMLGLLDSYREGRDDSQKDADQAAAAHPLAYGLASAAGDAPLAALGPANAIYNAALMGGVSSLGDSHADLTKGEVGQAAADTALGAGTGAATGAVLHGLRVSALGKLAQGFGLRAMGATKATLNELGLDKARQVVQDLIDAGIINARSSKEGIAQAIDDQAPFFHGHADNIIDAADATKQPFDTASALRQGHAEMVAPNASRAFSQDDAAQGRQLLIDAGQDAADKGGWSFRDANNAKQDMWDKVNDFKEVPAAQRQQRAFGGVLKGQLESQVGNVLGPEHGDDLRETNKFLGSLLSGKDILQQGLEAEDAQNFLRRNVGKGVGGVAGFMLGGAPGAALGAAAEHGLEKFGPQVAAVGANGLRKLVQGGSELIGPELSKMVPGVTAEALRNIGRALMGSNGGQFQNQARILTSSSHPEVDHFIMAQQNPAYAKAVQDLQHGDDDAH